MTHSCACHQLTRIALIERVARALREPEIMADPRIPAGRCVLCLENLPISYHVVDMRGDVVRAWDTAPGSPEEAAAIALKGTGELLISAVKLCYCARTEDIQHAAVLYNRERSRPKPAPARPDDSFSGGARY